MRAVSPRRASEEATPVELDSSRALLTVRTYIDDIAPRWDEFVRNNPGGTPFHLTAWKRCIEETYGYKSQYFYVERDGKITAVVPVFSVSNWITGQCLLSTPFAVYGGVCSDDAESENVLVQHLQRLGESQSVEYLELRYKKHTPREGFSPVSRYATFTAELSSDSEANLKRLPKDTRYMIRKAAKSPLRGQHGIDQLDAFYRLFCQSMKRLGTPVFPLSLFKNLIEEFDPAVDLYIVYLGTDPVAGVFSLFYRDTIFPYYAGATQNANSLAANNFMYWELMKYAVERGCRKFDFGRSKLGTGAYNFKSQWNMDVHVLDYQVYLIKRKDIPNFSPINPKFDLATRIWKRVPESLANWIGPRVVRWFP